MENQSRTEKYVPPHLRRRPANRHKDNSPPRPTPEHSADERDLALPKDTPKRSTEGDPQYLYIIRHGDRWDEENPTYKTSSTRPLDTPLSQLGHNQARETGLLLDQTFQKDGITSPEDIVWLSSPFLRCLQTTDEALNASTIPNARSIWIKPEMAVSEWGAYHTATLPSLQERSNYFPRLDTSYQSMFTPLLNEEPPVFWERCKRAASSIGEHYAYRPNTAIVVVSHAAPSLGIAESAAGLTWADIAPAAPCGVYRLRRTSAQQETWTLDWNGRTDHLSDTSGCTKPWHPLDKKKRTTMKTKTKGHGHAVRSRNPTVMYDRVTNLALGREQAAQGIVSAADQITPVQK